VGYVTRRGRRITVKTITGPAPARRRRHEFIMVTRAQADRLTSARHIATLKIFYHLQFLAFKSRGKPVRLGNITLMHANIARQAKRLALRELECLGLIQVTRCQHHSPEVVVLDLPEEGGNG
jgi:hypothetical protein